VRLKYLVLFICISCNQNLKETSSSYIDESSENVSYAKGFSINQYDELTELVVKEPFQGAGEEYTYWLIPKDLTIPDSLKGESIIRTPVKEIVVTSTSHVPLLDYLDETDALTGFPSMDYVSSPKMRARIDAGMVKELGRDNSLNFEVLVSLQPELVMTYLLNGDRNQLERIKNAGIPVLINADYLEKHPLGRAEWIKVTGLLFDKNDKADSIFNTIVSEYNFLKQQVSEHSQAPTVMTGIMYGDTWYLPGGKNYAAHLLADAGLNYLWKSNNESGFLQLSFEAVYDKAKSADFWIGTASFDNLKSLRSADNRYTWFDAYQQGEVYTYTKRLGPKGGNEYLELGYLRPDIILGDLIQIAHPGVMGDRELFFYEKLE
jgi:iron complex transport system substrate-binding protein